MSNILSFALAHAARKNRDDVDESWVELAKHPGVLNQLFDQIKLAPRPNPTVVGRRSRAQTVPLLTNHRQMAV
ncbi:hypothetical protein ACSBLW_03110 [Thioclava sp. FR2]|uniref:hypothetical protein n=1 Tax=Thioclava sp. FR2 TaxID=3445780 RepID=UPI003EBA95BE